LHEYTQASRSDNAPVTTYAGGMAPRISRRRLGRPADHRGDQPDADEADSLEQAWAKAAGRARRRAVTGRIRRKLPEALYHLIEIIEVFRP
jgi:hypothetical protein